MRRANDAPPRPSGHYVLYWMIAARRLQSSHTLDRAVEHARTLGKPLLIFEPLRCGYPFASDRLHRFVLDGMAGKRKTLERAGVGYYPYVEPSPDAGRGLLEALARHACVVVTDDSPVFFLPRMVEAAARRLDVLLEAVDSNGLLPLHHTDRVHVTAQAFRRVLQKALPPVLGEAPAEDPLRAPRLPRAAALPQDIVKRWPPADSDLLAGKTGLGSIPIDHAVGPTALRGGEDAALEALDTFLEERLPRYHTLRNDPEADATSGLSPWLHFGHLSTWTVLARLARREGWSPADLGPHVDGAREGWWGMSAPAEAFLDQVVTWRELGFNMAVHRPGPHRYDALPGWAVRTLAEHAGDARKRVYSREELERGRTHDPLWNASQMQLVREGRLHGYLRMLWGKSVLAWSRSPRKALDVLLELNDRYALDGRDPNSISGTFWVFGRYDRPWPERPVFGTLRAMTSASAMRKFSLEDYIARHDPNGNPQRTLRF